jgi:S1-C subfamily serine protease
VAAFAGDFDDVPEDESPSQPLPPEDRLWRHPSELGALGVSFPLDPITVRRRWLASQPSKASAWTAGLVGALLATGIVALGTHLASAFTANSPSTNSRIAGATLTSQPESAAGGLDRLPVISVGSELASYIAAAGRSIVYMDVTRGSGESRCLGVGIRADGMLLAPAAQLAGATSIVVTLADGSSYVGELVGSDASDGAASSGLALVHINGVSDLPVAPLDSSRSTAASATTTIAVTSPGGSISVGTATSAGGTTSAGRTVLIDALSTDMSATAAPAGSLLLGTDGQVAGIVTGSSSGRAVATPAWIASMVADELVSSRAVVHGWLGIEGTTASAQPRGVHVTVVARESAAYQAGLRSGDTIVSISGHRIATMPQLQAQMYFIRPGARVALGLVRGGHDLTVDAVLGARPMG